MKIEKREIYSIPNCLSYLRLAILPFFIYIYINATNEVDYIIASTLILISGLTDFADGYIARRFNMITQLGKALDPFADKCTQVAVAFCLMFRFPFAIPLFIILILKDGFLAVSSYYMYRKGLRLNGARWYGKVATAVFYVSMVIIVLWTNIPINYANILILISMIFMMIAFICYVNIYWDMYKKRRIN